VELAPSLNRGSLEISPYPYIPNKVLGRAGMSI